MTTTPTASPELPDLDRLLSRAEMIAKWLETATMKQSAADVQALIALARRAQPEGELDDMDLRDPWVVAACKADHLCPSELSSPDRWRWKAAYMRGQLAQPEGEAHGTDGDNMMRRYGPHVKALIAAGNGPGYPKALGGLFAAISDHVRAQPEGEVWDMLNEIYRLNPTPEAQALVKKIDRKFEAVAADLRAALDKPEAEAPAPRVIGGQRWSKEAEMTEGWVAAQQAAAPGAEPVAVVDEGDDGLFVDIIYGPDGSALKLGDKLYLAAPSAPGTPEAPANQDAKDAERYRALRDAKTIPAQVWNALERGEDVDEAVDLLIDLHKPIPLCEPCKAGRYNECEQVFPCVLPRAAQIDGGKGEEASHG